MNPYYFIDEEDCLDDIETEQCVCYRYSLCSDMASFQQNNTFCDVKLITKDDKVINAHKAVLAASSPYFMDLFKNDPKSEYKVEFSKPVMDNIIRFIYRGVIEVPEDDEVTELINSIDTIGNDSMGYCIAYCIKYVVTRYNALNIYDSVSKIFEEKADIYHVMDTVETSICSYLKYLYNDTKFKIISTKSMINILSNDTLNIDDENEAVTVLINRLTYFPEEYKYLIPLIRWFHVDKIVIEEFKKHPLIKNKIKQSHLKTYIHTQIDIDTDEDIEDTDDDTDSNTDTEKDKKFNIEALASKRVSHRRYY
ncbi:BTB Kelch-domain containing protein [Murmansk poxvirus]|uniref:BTB Kelch-domain containing protein n=1 Tax=Murmansk poxvirus TaxID=2025359 RepID=A0A223FMJ9_9POXV|nr:BTB Kelch-domain containing protein [Murmansk poxvirus]AST09213.1 BTB Kelch-domain containing protein [Murmansk poxvirus]